MVAVDAEAQDCPVVGVRVGQALEVDVSSDGSAFVGFVGVMKSQPKSAPAPFAHGGGDGALEDLHFLGRVPRGSARVRLKERGVASAVVLNEVAQVVDQGMHIAGARRSDSIPLHVAPKVRSPSLAAWRSSSRKVVAAAEDSPVLVSASTSRAGVGRTSGTARSPRCGPWR